MHPPDSLDCPFRAVVFDAIRELEETKLKFSEISEKVRHCENQLNNVLNVMVNCGIRGTNFQAQVQIQNGLVETSNDQISGDRAVCTSGSGLESAVTNDCIYEISRNIKPEPPELNESESVTDSQASSRKRSLLLDSINADDHTEEGLGKRCKNENDVVDENFGHKVSRPECNGDSEIVAGSVVPVIGRGTQDDLSREPQHDKDPKVLLNGNSDLANDCLFTQLSDVICQKTLDAVKFFGFTRMTDVQARVIRLLLSGRNMVVSSRRGSGKTIAFLIPAIEIIYRLNFRQCDGTRCVIICPTNELVMQTYGVLMGLMQYHEQTYGMLLQVKLKKSFLSESDTLAEGVNILVSTPAKLLQCLDSKSTGFRELECVIVDDCDLVLAKSAKAMKKILNLLPSCRQIALFTASELPCSAEVVRLFRHGTTFVSVDNKDTCVIPEGIEQYYVCCEAWKRTFLIYKILKKWHKSEKVVVVFTSAIYMTYFKGLLPRLGIPVHTISERYGSEEQINSFLNFCSSKTGILLCHSVLSVGLDIPAVSWVVHYDCLSVKDYICSTGLTARGINGKGKSLILLYPSQKNFLNTLQENGISVQEHINLDFKNGIKAFHKKLQALITNDKILKKAAEKAACACMVAMKYSSHLPQDQSLNLAKVFGLKGVPFVWKCQNGTSKLRAKTKLKKQTPRKKKIMSKKQKLAKGKENNTACITKSNKKI